MSSVSAIRPAAVSGSRLAVATKLLILCLCLSAPHTAFASGKLEDARSKYFGEVQSKLHEMKRNLDSKNFAEAKRSADAFKELLTKVGDDFLYVDEAVKALDSEPQRQWTGFYGTGSAWRYLSLYSGAIQTEIGQRDHTESLRYIEDNYEKCGNELNKLTEMFKEYGRVISEKYRKLEVITTSWK